MTSITTRIAGLATLALAALPMAALSTNAHAAPVAVQVADLNLNSEAGLAAFHQRAEAAAQAYCLTKAPAHALATQAACIKGVRTEAIEKLAGAKQSQLAARNMIVAAR